MKLDTLNDLLVHELQDMHSAEQQLTEALPKLAKLAHAPDLRDAITSHLQETQRHVELVRSLLDELNVSLDRTKCAAMAGILKEGSELLSEDAPPAVRDAALIGSAQRVEHYEIAVYGTLRAMAEQLNLPRVVSVIEQILQQEKAADKKLSSISDHVNSEAMQPLGDGRSN